MSETLVALGFPLVADLAVDPRPDWLPEGWLGNDGRPNAYCPQELTSVSVGEWLALEWVRCDLDGRMLNELARPNELDKSGRRRFHATAPQLNPADQPSKAANGILRVAYEVIWMLQEIGHANEIPPLGMPGAVSLFEAKEELKRLAYLVIGPDELPELAKELEAHEAFEDVRNVIEMLQSRPKAANTLELMLALRRESTNTEETPRGPDGADVGDVDKNDEADEPAGMDDVSVDDEDIAILRALNDLSTLRISQ
ncbi:MAG: hypothetical protein IH991_19795, partial [Planctomycetes bacterium]|nr:hypothetical protein [Planctomycetota bacterium]